MQFEFMFALLYLEKIADHMKLLLPLFKLFKARRIQMNEQNVLHRQIFF
jgi:hypothetical protein